MTRDRLNEHFNTPRTHLLRVLIEGVKDQYGDFFAGCMDAFKVLRFPVAPATMYPTGSSGHTITARSGPSRMEN
ncbi:MAG TPA: putative phage tail assembly chaperone [Xylella sp.]